MADDRRRRQYVPLYVRFATGETGQKIIGRFGAEGIAVWSCLLAAAKRNDVQGEFVWVSETDAWDKLGLRKSPPSFTFEEFVAYLGRLHRAATKRHGEDKTTSIRGWNDWNTTIKREQDANKKRRKRAQTTGDNTRDKEAPIRGTEVEVEVEPPYPPQNGKTEPLHCTRCPTPTKHANADDLAGHLEDVHGITNPEEPT